MQNLSYSIIIPAYNESQRIAASLDKIIAYTSEQKWMTEILVVNDGSRDNTSDIVREYARTHTQVRLI
ncbi:MAG TPA: glycosyltransferase, partial [Terriglobales bacterium]